VQFKKKTYRKVVLDISVASYVHNLIPVFTKALGLFARRILRAIYGPTKQGDECSFRNNKELYDLYKDEDIVTFIKLGL
jgi:hypothetical protein